MATYVRTPKENPECWSCGQRCKAGTHLASAGWHCRKIPVGGGKTTEVYCPKCFEDWGWPDHSAYLSVSAIAAENNRALRTNENYIPKVYSVVRSA